MSLFLSYSGRRRQDKVQALYLLWRLESLGIATWKYEDDGEVQWAEEIWPACAEKIERSEVFLLVLTPSALHSPWVAKELSLAIELFERRGRPLILTAASQEVMTLDWSPPFAGLRTSKYHVISSTSWGDELIVLDLATRLDIRYISPPPQNKRMPLIHRLVEEILNSTPDRPEEYRTLRSLFPMIRDCEAAYERRDLEETLYALRFFIRNFQNNYPNARPYYPRLIELVVRAEIASEESLERLERLLDEAERMTADPRADENSWGLVGWLENALGHPVESLRAYERAHQINPQDYDIAFNLVWVALCAGIHVTAERLVNLFGAPPPIQTMARGGDLRLAFLMSSLDGGPGGITQHAQADLDRTARIAEVIDLLYARALSKRDETLLSTARALLEQLHPNELHSTLRHRLARVCHALGDFRAAEDHLNVLLEQNRNSFQWTAELALTFKRSGQTSRASALAKWARQNLDVGSARVAEGNENVDYFRGMIAYLSGEEAEARIYFRDSRRADDQWYGRLEDPIFVFKSRFRKPEAD